MAGRSYRLHPDAEADLVGGAEWYESRRAGLGLEFIAAVQTRIDAVVEAPQRWRRVGNARRALIPRFPYAIVYRERDDGEIEILAVAHLSRRPGYWAQR